MEKIRNTGKADSTADMDELSRARERRPHLLKRYVPNYRTRFKTLNSEEVEAKRIEAAESLIHKDLQPESPKKSPEHNLPASSMLRRQAMMLANPQDPAFTATHLRTVFTQAIKQVIATSSSPGVHILDKNQLAAKRVEAAESRRKLEERQSENHTTHALDAVDILDRIRKAEQDAMGDTSY